MHTSVSVSFRAAQTRAAYALDVSANRQSHFLAKQGGGELLTVFLGGVALDELFDLWNRRRYLVAERNLLVASSDLTLDVRIPLENLPTETVQAILDDIVRGANGLAAFPTPPWRVAPLPDASARALNCPRPEPRHGDSLVRHHVHFDTQLSHDVLLNVMKEVSYPDSPPLRICTAHPSLLLVRILHRIQLEVDTVGYLSQVVRGVAPSHSLASQIATHEHRRNAQFFLLRLFVELVLDTGHDNPRNSDAVWYPRLVAAVPTCYSDFGQFRAMVHRWQPELLVEDATNWQLSLMGDNSLYHELAARNRSAFGHVLAWLDRGRVVEDGFEPLSYDPHHHRFQRPHDAARPPFNVGSRRSP